MSDLTAEQQLRYIIEQFAPSGFRDEDGVWHDGPWQLLGHSCVAALLARAERAERALARYGTHQATCDRVRGSFGFPPPCSCGFTEVLAALGAATEPRYDDLVQGHDADVDVCHNPAQALETQELGASTEDSGGAPQPDLYFRTVDVWHQHMPGTGAYGVWHGRCGLEWRDPVAAISGSEPLLEDAAILCQACWAGTSDTVEPACSHEKCKKWPSGGFVPEGEIRECPDCGQRFVHIIEESDGCWWEPIPPAPLPGSDTPPDLCAREGCGFKADRDALAAALQGVIVEAEKYSCYVDGRDIPEAVVAAREVLAQVQNARSESPEAGG